MKETIKNNGVKNLDKLQEKYIKKLPTKLEDIEKKWRHLKLHFDRQELKNLHRMVHSLTGSTGTYGFHNLHQAMRDLEVYIQQLFDYSGITATQQSEISRLVDAVKTILKDDEGQAKPTIIESSPRLIENKLIVYLAKNETAFEHTLQMHLSEIGYTLTFIKTISELQVFVSARLPAVIIVSEFFLEDSQISGVSILKHSHQINVLCIAKQNNVQTRLKAIHAGVSLFLHQPTDVFFLTNRLVHLCGLSAKGDYRVLILDDDIFLANYYASVLGEAGMVVRKICNPMDLMQELQDFNPHLLLLDLYLPECNGLELAMMVRQEECYASLPIIFISTESDRFKQLSMLKTSGGDDFLTKPVLPQNLVAAVKSRAQRSILLATYITQDSMTKLLNHDYILTQLEHEILRAHRERTKLSFAMIDLDDFKSINDKYGHPTGDSILKNLAGMLSGMVRRTDFVGRYGGEEFVIILPNTDVEHAILLMNNLREAFALHAFESGDYQFNATFSVGIAGYPTFQTVNSMVAAADRALYQAKVKGRNRVEVT